MTPTNTTINQSQVHGAIIMKVLPGTPAADAGLRRHDVVIEMRGRPVRTADEAKQVVDESSVGDVLTLKASRGGLAGRGVRRGISGVRPRVARNIVRWTDSSQNGGRRGGGGDRTANTGTPNTEYRKRFHVRPFLVIKQLVCGGSRAL